MIRDCMENDCPSGDYDPSPRLPEDPPPPCETDGHYLCQNCKWRDPIGEAVAKLGPPWMIVRSLP